MDELDKGLRIDVLPLKKAALVLRASNHPLRQEIIKVIHQHKRITVMGIYVKLSLEQSITSQHLAVLRKTQFVTTERAGKHTFYSVSYKRLNEVQ